MLLGVSLYHCPASKLNQNNRNPRQKKSNRNYRNSVMIWDESVHLFLPCGFPNQEFKLQSSNCKTSSGKDPSAKAKLAGFHLTI